MQNEPDERDLVDIFFADRNTVDEKNKLRREMGRAEIARVEIGDSIKDVRGKVSLAEVPSTKLFEGNSYGDILCFLTNRFLVVWPYKDSRAANPDAYVIGVFSPHKTLVDLVHLIDGDVRPLRADGKYSKSLASVKVGLSVDEMYSLLGKKSPIEYRRGADERWEVRWMFLGLSERHYFFTADAATGKIIHAGEMKY